MLQRNRKVLVAAVVVIGVLLGATGAASAAPMWVAVPVPRSATSLSALQQPHHDYPAADIPVRTGTSVYAVVGGDVTRTGWMGSCGYGVIMTRGNTEYTYCHGNGTIFVRPGQTVNYGTRIMLSGSTGNSSGPHLHFQVRVNGQLRCPQPMLRAAWNGITIDPQRLPASGCTN